MTALTVIEARDRIARVKASVDTIREDLLALWSGQAWKSLGYESWDALCDAEFEVRLALPITQRREVVADLTEAGMSSRAIAGALGVDQKTVVNDRQSGEELSSPATVTGTDGKQYPAKVTQTTRVSEATKIEREIDEATGEILEPSPALDEFLDTPERRDLIFRKRVADAMKRASQFAAEFDPSEVASVLTLDEFDTYRLQRDLLIRWFDAVLDSKPTLRAIGDDQ